MFDPKKWLSNYGDYLFSIAFTKRNNKETAEDLVQDTFLSAVKAVSLFKEGCIEKTGLVTILNNNLFDYYRKKFEKKQAIQNELNKWRYLLTFFHILIVSFDAKARLYS